ncbi:MAG: hypothetical protein MI724_11990 [Spirochaetales bacterium]|nr:hypothetical protein [Spirochaetales bacterium]
MRTILSRLAIVGSTALVFSACTSLAFGTPEEPETFLRTIELSGGETEIDSYVLSCATQNTGTYLHTIVGSGSRFGDMRSMVSGEFAHHRGCGQHRNDHLQPRSAQLRPEARPLLL